MEKDEIARYRCTYHNKQYLLENDDLKEFYLELIGILGESELGISELGETTDLH